MNFRKVALIVALATIFPLSGCETTSREEKDLMLQRIADIDKRVKFLHGNVKVQADMAANLEQLQRTMLTLTEQMKELNERSQSITENVTSSGAAGNKIVLERTQAANARLEEINRKLNKLMAETLAFISLMEARNRISRRDHRAEVAKFYVSGSEGGNGATATGEEQAADGVAGSDFARLTPEDLYQQSYEAYLKGSHEVAVNGFTAYLERYPDTELSDNAAFWLGEAYYGKEEYGKALKAFDDMVADYPDSNKAPAGLLRSAFAMSKLGSEKSTIERLEKIIELYPTSSEAIIATERLDSIRGAENKEN